jgi:hypothetical protein
MPESNGRISLRAPSIQDGWFAQSQTVFFVSGFDACTGLHRLPSTFSTFSARLIPRAVNLESPGGIAAQIAPALAVAPAPAYDARIRPLRILPHGKPFREQYKTGGDDILGSDLTSLFVQIIDGIHHKIIQGDLCVHIGS